VRNHVAFHLPGPFALSPRAIDTLTMTDMSAYLTPERRAIVEGTQVGVSPSANETGMEGIANLGGDSDEDDEDEDMDGQAKLVELERKMEAIQRVADAAKEEAARQLRAAQEAMAKKARKAAKRKEEEAAKARAADEMRAQAKKLLDEADEIEKTSRRGKAKAKDSGMASLSSAAVTTSWDIPTAPLLSSAITASPSPAAPTLNNLSPTPSTPAYRASASTAPEPASMERRTPSFPAPAAPTLAAVSLPTTSTTPSESPAISAVLTMGQLSASYVANALGNPDVPVSPAIVQATQQIVGETTLTAVIAMAAMAYWQRLGRVPTTDELSSMLGVDARPPPVDFPRESSLRSYHTAVLGYLDGLVGKWAEEWQGQLPGPANQRRQSSSAETTRLKRKHKDTIS
jgi:hypothetical protein